MHSGTLRVGYGPSAVAQHIPSNAEKQEREMVNQTRVWLLCFNLDRSTAAQFGKPSTIKED